MSVFKAYDIRGRFPEEFNLQTAQSIGKAYAVWTKAKKIVVGYDMRPSSLQLFEAITQGLTDQGVEIINIGLCSTPICYFATGELKVDGCIMITASHNGAGWNGFKMCLKNAAPMSYENGIKEIQQLVDEDDFTSAEIKGSISKLNYGKEYGRNVLKHVFFSRKPKIVVDYGNAVGSKEIESIEHLFEIIPLHKELDGTFPNHEANPLKVDTLRELQRKVIEHQADFGAAFDGDADRCGFVDNKGQVVGMDLITALIALDMISKNGPDTFLYDLRSSKAVPEAIEAAGGIAKMTRVGHAVIKEDMRRKKAAFAGELSGHYYFRDNYYSESQATVIVLLCNILEEQDKTLEEMIRPLRKYANTGEINRPMNMDKDELIQILREEYKDGKQIFLDGISVDYENWWLNVRPSNTEPKMRIFLEAQNEALLEVKKQELLGLIDKINRKDQ